MAFEREDRPVEFDREQTEAVRAAGKQVAQRIVDANLARVEQRIAFGRDVHAAQNDMAAADIDLGKLCFAVHGKTEHGRNGPGDQRASADREQAHDHESDCHPGPSGSPAHHGLNTHPWRRGLLGWPDVNRT